MQGLDQYIQYTNGLPYVDFSQIHDATICNQIKKHYSSEIAKERSRTLTVRVHGYE